MTVRWTVRAEPCPSRNETEELALRKSDFSTVELARKKNPIFSQGGKREGFKLRTIIPLCTNLLFFNKVSAQRWTYAKSYALSPTVSTKK